MQLTPTSSGTNWLLVIQIVIPALLGGLAGALLGSWLTSRREAAARRFTFVEKQVTQFYSPMAGLRREIQAKSTLRARLEMETDATWRELIRNRPAAQVEALRQERLNAFLAAIPYNNQQLRDELSPSYRKMLELFRDQYWLAEPGTRAYYAAFSEYVEI